MLKRFIRNEKGLTLIELLAVIVILGIIAAIAIPSVGALIDNSKKDAHISNAKQLVNATRLAITADTSNTNKAKFTMTELVNGGYLEKVPKSPGDEGDYDGTNSFVTVTKDSNGNLSYKVTLATADPNSHKYIDDKDPEKLTRKDVTLKKP
ncbi:prepilin-type N-terminal cleavage/methylation domain-containing protein [Bhargavaea massiliensis]